MLGRPCTLAYPELQNPPSASSPLWLRQNANHSRCPIDFDTLTVVVTPSINPDGLVNLLVNANITTRLAEKVQVSSDVSAEAFSTRSAVTQVAVLDGQTIVIGGLIEDQLSETIKQVPLLGSLPIIGYLFKRRETLASKTELLIFMTPHVAAVAAELTAISNTERSRSTLSTDKTGAELFRKHMENMEPGPVEKDD